MSVGCCGVKKMKNVRRRIPWGVLIPFVVVGFAACLMIFAMSGTNSADKTGSNATESAIPSVSGEAATGAPNTMRNDTSADSARGGSGPLNKSK
jgi:amino acid transporter